jgi:hypothetical protein
MARSESRQWRHKSLLVRNGIRFEKRQRRDRARLRLERRGCGLSGDPD